MTYNKFNKVIVWGHKTGHTHGYIHSSYYKAFKWMGYYETFWLDDSDLQKHDVGFFNNALYFTEDQASHNIPLSNSCTYILHHCNNQKYLDAGAKVINLCNYLKYCEDGISFNYKETGNTVVKIKNVTFWDEKAKALYQPWATDLTPDEIKFTDYVLFDSNKGDINYVGTIWNENNEGITKFNKACLDNHKILRSFGSISDDEHRNLIRQSYIAPDIRGDWHVECGYLPCRIFKNLSYGVSTGTNSAHVHSIFGDRVAYSPDCYNLFSECVDKYSQSKASDIVDNMLYIRENHTYVNRINTILEMLERI